LEKLPTLNTPANDQQEEEFRTKLLSQLMHGKTKLDPKFSDHYELGDLLGDGAFGFVFTAKNKQGGEVAVKFIIRSKISKENWETLENGDEVPKEVALLRKLQHPNIIRFIDYVCEANFVLLITELFGTSWDASNRELTPFSNPGLKFKYRPSTVQADDATIKARTSCDLFECIDARINY
jgi:serine/threonine protein kinase